MRDRRPALEGLESRQMFTASADVAETTHGGACGCSGCRPVTDQTRLTAAAVAAETAASLNFALRVDFTNSTSSAARGHKLDYGAGYGRRGNGLTYGWSTSRISSAVVRDSAYPSQAESNIVMGSASWSMNVPNGWYDVRVLMGDPTITTGVDYRLNVEGQVLANGKPYEPNHPFVEGYTTVQVTDGRLTLTSADRAVGNRLATVTIIGRTEPTTARDGIGIAWQQTSSVQSPLYRAESGAVRVGNKLYVMGGFTESYDNTTSRVDILDIPSGTWSSGAAMPGPNTHFGAASDGQYIYVAGGQYGPQLSIDGSSEVFRYDIANDTWSSFGNLPDIRFGGQMAYLNGRLHFYGGNDATRVRSRPEHWVLNLGSSNRTWRTAAPLPQATDHHSTIVVNNAIYVIGGEVEHGTSYLQNSGLFRYNDAANTWTKLADLPIASSHHEASTLTDGKRIFLMGGQRNGQQLMTNVFSYDIARNRWEEHTALPTARKAGFGWIVGSKLYYSSGDDLAVGGTRTTYVGEIGA